MSLIKQLALRFIRTKFRILSRLSKRKAAEKAFTLFCTPQQRTRKNLPKIFVAAENIQLAFGEDTLQGYRWNGASPKKVLILHGFESSITNFDGYISPLVEKGYCVLGFDAPAHGRSTGKIINVLLYKEMIRTIQDHYGPVRFFIAHSFGGLAISLALESWAANEGYKAVLIAPATETTTAVNYLFKVLRLPEDLRADFENLILQKGGKPTSWFSVARAVPNIRSQILWVHDKDDDMTPFSDVVPVIKKGYPNIQFHITEGLGHRRIYRDSSVVEKIIQFL